MASAFLNDESGAVTVDWVVLTAALVGLGVSVGVIVASGADTQSNAIADFLEKDDIIRTSFGDDAAAMRGYGGWASLTGRTEEQQAEVVAQYDDLDEDGLSAEYLSQYGTATGNDGNLRRVATDNLLALAQQYEDRGGTPPETELSVQEVYESNGGTAPDA